MMMTISRLNRAIALSDQQYVLGRREKTTQAALNIGQYYALDGSLGAPVYLDVSRPHVIFICGKRGYGKSYTIGVLLEELSALPWEIKQHLAVIVLDTLGIFWTTQYSSGEQTSNIPHHDRKPKGFPVRLLVPASAIAEYTSLGIAAECFSLRVAQLTPAHWHQLFEIKATDPVGIALTRAILHLRAKGDEFSMADLQAFVQQDRRCEETVKIALENFLLMAESWGVFDTKGLDITDIAHPGALTILDLSHFHSPILKDIVTALVSERIFEQRVRQRKRQEQKKMGYTIEEKGIPLVWLAVDEAQVFVPQDKHTQSKAILIDEWMRQGRQPGLSLIMATQRPSAVEPEVLSHSDLIICHRLTAQEDIEALGRIRPTYLHGDISESIKKIGTEKGVALLLDDTSESLHVIKIRSRLSWHGGAEPVIEHQQKPRNSGDEQ